MYVCMYLNTHTHTHTLHTTYTHTHTRIPIGDSIDAFVNDDFSTSASPLYVFHVAFDLENSDALWCVD